jgi:hypothetical protein
MTRLKSITHVGQPSRPALRRRMALVLTMCATAACATVPTFTPERPLREAGSLPEALHLCGQYEVPKPIERPVAIRPYLDCLDEAAAVFAWSPASWPGFMLFRRELEHEYALLNGETFSVARAEAMETAIRAVLRTLWRGERLTAAATEGDAEPVSDEPYTEAERRAVRDLFPQTGAFLGARDWITSPTVALSPELEKLRASIAGLAAVATSGARFADRIGQAPECERLRALKRESRYLGQVWRDREGFARVAPGSGEAMAADREFRAGLARTESALREARSQAASRSTRLYCVASASR